MPLSFCSIVDEMGTRIDDLEKSIGELMAHAGIDEAAAAGKSGEQAVASAE